MIGYQIGHPESILFSSGRSINTNYVDGISVTQGAPRQHVWTFAAGIEDQQRGFTGTCPCVTGSTVGSRIPSFVGQNYFCESGLTQYLPGTGGVFYPNGDPLWDGQGCGSNSTNFSTCADWGIFTLKICAKKFGVDKFSQFIRSAKFVLTVDGYKMDKCLECFQVFSQLRTKVSRMPAGCNTVAVRSSRRLKEYLGRCGHSCTLIS